MQRTQVRIFDGRSIGDRELFPGGLSGSGRAPIAHSSGGQLLVTFQTDSGVTESGFEFGWINL